MLANISQFEQLGRLGDPTISQMSVFNEKIRRPGDTIHSGNAVADIYDWLYEFGPWNPETPEEALDAVEKIDDSIRTVKNTSELMLYTLDSLRKRYSKIATVPGVEAKK